jgi:hypothetical protein
MDPIVSKLLDYGVLGIAVLALSYALYKVAMFIVGEIKQNRADCEADRQKLIRKLDDKDAVILAQSNKCLSSIDENTKVTKELCTEIRLRRINEATPKGNRT